jgi:hypothetical protein
MAGASFGCDLDDDPDALFLADARVEWTIEGSTAPALCSAYGIEDWIIEVRGPDSFDVVVDCRADFWTSGTALFDLLEGFYTIRVRAVDAFDVTLAVIATDIELIDDGFVDELEFTFLPEDFF